ncbi:MAG: hypothetical protein JW864_03155 [Spirochaetes bacterium]|nr:hypothetical protein [Spirochaetota bacterium]
MKILRKDFIKLSGSCFTAAVSLSVFSSIGCSGIRRNDIKESGADKRLKKQLGEDRYTILYLASLAPSPHNTQPWYVKIINQDKWIVCADQARCMKATDPDNHRLILSIGAFAENLRLAAGALGYHARITVVSRTFFVEDVLQIDINRSDPDDYPVKRIVSRKTLKNAFINKNVSNEHISVLSESLKGHFFYFPRDIDHSDCIRKDAVAAFQEWLDSDEAQREHVHWLRIAGSEAEEKRDGITTEGMEIKGITGWFIRTFFSNEDFAGSFLKKESMKFTEKISSEGGGYVIITGYGKTVEAMIDVGRRFERMLLRAGEIGVGIQPMTQILEMQSGRDSIRSNHKPSIDPQLVLRIGYVEKYSDPVTLRRPPADFVKFI